jgi:RHS repeat-associated protein
MLSRNFTTWWSCKSIGRVIRALAGFALGACLATAATAQTVTYFHNDLSGSPAMATDASGQVLWKESYRPYGSKNTNSAEGNQQAIGFAGRPFDASTGLSYMDARYYDPVLGRFMGVDPAAPDAANVHSLNRYAYANNNPLRYVDPDGNSPLDVAFLVWDLGKLGMAVYTGVGVGAAVADVAMSVIGVASPVPFSGQAMKAARVAGAVDRAADVGRAVDHAADAAKGATLKPGPFAKESIPGHMGKPTAAEQKQVNALMEKNGCHTCGTKNPGTKSGNSVVDHQPPQALGETKKFLPHCIDCMRRQGGETLQELVKRANN